MEKTPTLERMRQVLEQMRRARVAVFGDFCLDAYWLLDPDSSETSVETGLPVRRVHTQRYSPGGAGNVTVNLAALGVARVTAIGVAGRDAFGDQMVRLLSAAGVETTDLYRGQDDWQTCVYAKPCRGEAEESRIDFGGGNVPDGVTIQRLCASLEAAAATHDVLIVNQQLPRGLVVAPLIAAINRLTQAHPKLIVIVDARDVAASFERVSLKLNAAEAARVAADGTRDASDVPALAGALQARMGRPVFVTRGERGLIVADGRRIEQIPGVQVAPPIDPVGAGDALLAVLAAALAVDTAPDAPLTAGYVANLAASVTLRKVGTTGSASPAEILAAAEQADYVYLPELASDLRQAAYLPDTEIEAIRALPDNLEIRHAIFDHDGTLSTLREGWEKIMEPIMLKAILGPRYQNANETRFARVTQACREFIDRTTGIQTLVQMQGLVALVRQFGCVPASEILDEHGYKKIYNDALLEMVSRRVQKLERGELCPEDFQLKNAHALLRALHARGVTLYLASGTDVQDVIAEARAMGYADVFGDRIFGAVGDVNVEAKKLVLARIMQENGLSDANLVTFGDGPVEIRETRRRGGVTVGVASDEVRRFGLNPAKRKRLIRAGADLIVPDFSQLTALLQTLRLPEAAKPAKPGRKAHA